MHKYLFKWVLLGVCCFSHPFQASAITGGNHATSQHFYLRDHAGQQPPGLTNTQQNLAGEARRQGVEVKLRGGWATHVKVRGNDLGLNRSFSRGRGLAYRRNASYEQNAIAVLDNLSGVLGVARADKEFAPRKVTEDRLGYTHVRMGQEYNGLKVVGGDLIVHFDKTDRPYQVTGTYVPEMEASTDPQLSGSIAIEVALKDVDAQAKVAAAVAVDPKLVVFARDCAPVLAYEFVLATPSSNQTAPGYWRYWIDAQSGEIISRYNDTKDIADPSANGANAAISGKILTGEGGSTKSVTGWHETGGMHYLYNKDMKWFVYNVSSSSTYPDSDTYAHRDSHDWDDSDRIEMSAALNFHETQVYFRNTHGLNSYNNANAYARANVHEGTSYVNAYWSPEKQQFFFGDGDGVTANSLAVLDVVGHEFTHAVTEHSADLIYYSESGALNESFSDIFGACIEFKVQPDGRGLYPSSSPGKADWLMGEDCWLSSHALRDMRNPRNSSTVGSGVQPSRYFGTNWYSGSGDNGGVHINSGVQNFFFYLLCEGGAGDNDGIGYNISGIGIDDAEQIAYRALRTYCTPGTDYRAVREAWISAAQDLNPVFVSAVEEAWLACGVGPLEILPSSALVFQGRQGGAFIPWRNEFTLKNNALSPVEWSIDPTASWLRVSPSSGTIAAGATVTLFVELTPAAEALSKDIYFESVKFRKSGGVLLGSRQVMLKVGQPDYLTEQFSSSDFDLSNMTITLTPDGSDSYYHANLLPNTSLPVNSSWHNNLVLPDDGSSSIALIGGKKVKLYGSSYSSLFVGSNGYITFGSGDSTYIESLSHHFSMKRISAFFDDLNPSAGGSVKWAQLSDRLVVTFSGVPKYGSSYTVTFQVEMFFDGVIRMSWRTMGTRSAVVGLSEGTGLPGYFQESDLSIFGWDYDQDGIANAWEMQYFGGHTNCVAHLDSDGDGYSNLEEYISGMHPLNSSSYMKVVDHSVSTGDGNDFVITWDPVEGREYSIWYTYNLQYVDFELLKGGMGYPKNSYTDSVDNAQSCRMYKVGVQLIE